MIDTDRIRMALAATPLCQNNWTEKEGNNPTMLCAVSAMVSFAGVQPDLIKKMADAMGGQRWFDAFASPVLLAEYGIPHTVARHIPGVFDRSHNEWKGVTAVLDLCEKFNMEELHHSAIVEDMMRFPQATVAMQWTATMDFGTSIAFTPVSFAKAINDMYYGQPVFTQEWKSDVIQKPSPTLIADKAAKEAWYGLTGESLGLWDAKVDPTIYHKFMLSSGLAKV